MSSRRPRHRKRQTPRPGVSALAFIQEAKTQSPPSLNPSLATFSSNNLLHMWKIIEIFSIFLHFTKPKLKLHAISVRSLIAKFRTVPSVEGERKTHG